VAWLSQLLALKILSSLVQNPRLDATAGSVVEDCSDAFGKLRKGDRGSSFVSTTRFVVEISSMVVYEFS
jgi:hypothetical protein